MKRTIFLANRAPLSRLSLMVSSIAVALVAFLGFSPAAQADWVSPHDFEYFYTAACGEESGVVEYMFTDIVNNTSAAIEVLITMDGETVESQLLNPGDSMPDFIRPWRRGMTAAPPLAGARCRAFIDNITVNAIFTVG